MTESDSKTTHALDLPGVRLVYDVRRNAASADPILVLIGSPMAASGFTTLAGHFGDRTVVTYDPRGTERSVVTDPAHQVTPDLHAEDLHRLIQEIGGPVDLFAASGGAVNALALVAAHPEDVRILVAHEPPLGSILPDREAALAASRAVHETYLRSGWGAGMAHFIAIASHKGEFPSDFADTPAPDPAMFGLPPGDDGSRNDPLLGEGIVTSTHYEPAWERVRAAPTRIVFAAGSESEGELAHRGAQAAAERLGMRAMTFPGDHSGLVGGEHGQPGRLDEFAAALREVLEQA